MGHNVDKGTVSSKERCGASMMNGRSVETQSERNNDNDELGVKKVRHAFSCIRKLVQ